MRPQILELLLGVAVSSVAGQGYAEDWDAAYTKATTALAKLSTSDKVGLVTGIGWGKRPCTGNNSPVNSINFRSLCLQDGPLGVRSTTGVTAFPPGIQAASTWDRSLMNDRGHGIGEETKALGINVILGPVCGPLGQFAQGGRNWEGFSSDPYLAGVAMEQTVGGIQDAGAQACAKNYIGNEQERNHETMNDDIDDRTMHELYLWPFAEAVRANVAAVMCSYNKIGGSWACENQHTLNDLLKTELGFKGYVVTDWNAGHSNTGAANAGLDMGMPGTDSTGKNPFWGSALQSAIGSGVAQTRLDDMAKRILASWYLTKQDSGYPSIAVTAKGGGSGRNVQGNHSTTARAVARNGIVLLKNSGNLLPLQKPKSIAIIGSGAVANPKGINSCVNFGCNQGTLVQGWGSGTATLPCPSGCITTRAKQDSRTVTTTASDTASQGLSAAQNADVAIVFITADSGEEYIVAEMNTGDRNDLNVWHNGNDLVKAVAGVNKNTIVVVNTVGPILLEAFADLPNMKAIVWAGLPGEEAGNALVDVLYGSVRPSGKLPYTIAKQASDYRNSIQATSDSFSEGVFIDYRHFDKNNIAPRYEFGYGLSYTTFNYSNIVITGAPTSGAASGTIVPGGSSPLFDTAATVTATITNSGSVTGAEVAQLYIGLPSPAPSSPVRQLRGFKKVSIEAGGSATVAFTLRRKDLSYWDTSGKAWKVPKGSITWGLGRARGILG